MTRSFLVVALLLLVLAPPPAAAGERDPDYDEILKAYKKKQWTELDRRAPEFLSAHPVHRFTHSVRFMVADSLRQRKRLREAAAAFEDYLARYPFATLADRSRGALVEVLNLDQRHAEALAAAETYLTKYSEGKAKDKVTYERAAALEGLRRFEAAADAYDAIEGKYREKAQHRIGIALFRGREFLRSRKALRGFLKRFPASSYESRVREYLFRADTPFQRIEDGVVLEYEGKYVGDPRFEAVRKRLPRLRAEALERIRKRLGVELPETFLIRFADAGRSRNGNFASTRLEVVKGEPRQMLILFTEHIVLGTFDLESTLTHELYHCLQRERLGEDHYATPKWVREGTAVYVSGQGPARTRLLAAETGRRTGIEDPVAHLVDGLGGRHTLDDYAEDVAAFESAEIRHGRKKVDRLLGMLLTTPDVEKAVKQTLGEDMATFERQAGERAREVLAPLINAGRKEVFEATRHLNDGRPDSAIRALPKNPGVYAPAVVYMRALAHYRAGRYREALTVVCEEYYPEHRTFSPLTDNAVLLEVKALKALRSAEYRKVAERARMDLEPTSAWRALLKVMEE